ncbi:MAG: hypothetical protein AB7F86_04275 [Bdellovibrionales bacterium]
MRGLWIVVGAVALVSTSSWADFQFYHQRYGLSDVYAKLVDNRGNGFEDLYGVRNFREVLKGVLYRGGANNVYHRDPKYKRANINPLPLDGLTNLCEEGFQHVVYLYAENYDQSPHQVTCSSLRGPQTMPYSQLGSYAETREILEVVFKSIQDSSLGPVYLHCWNGWHASGYISAISLRQFCGWSGDQAVEYWSRNTDNHDGSAYNALKRRIREFARIPALIPAPDMAAQICPN